VTSTFLRKTARRFGSKEDDSRKDAKHAKLEENRKLILFAPWSLDAKDFCETVLLNLLLDYGIGKKITRAKAQRVPSAKK